VGGGRRAGGLIPSSNDTARFRQAGPNFLRPASVQPPDERAQRGLDGVVVGIGPEAERLDEHPDGQLEGQRRGLDRAGELARQSGDEVAAELAGTGRGLGVSGDRRDRTCSDADAVSVGS